MNTTTEKSTTTPAAPPSVEPTPQQLAAAACVLSRPVLQRALDFIDPLHEVVCDLQTFAPEGTEFARRAQTILDLWSEFDGEFGELSVLIHAARADALAAAPAAPAGLTIKVEFGDGAGEFCEITGEQHQLLLGLAEAKGVTVESLVIDAVKGFLDRTAAQALPVADESAAPPPTGEDVDVFDLLGHFLSEAIESRAEPPQFTEEERRRVLSFCMAAGVNPAKLITESLLAKYGGGKVVGL